MSKTATPRIATGADWKRYTPIQGPIVMPHRLNIDTACDYSNVLTAKASDDIQARLFALIRHEGRVTNSKRGPQS